MRTGSHRRPLILAVAAVAVFSGAARGAVPESSPTVRGDDMRSPDRLTLPARRLTLDDLCTLLTRRTGVKHACADAATGDLQLLVRGTVGAPDLREAVGDVLGVEWTQAPGRSGALTVRRLREEAAEEQRLQAEWERGLAESLAQLIRTSALTDDAVKALPRPWSGRLAQPITREGTRVLAALEEADRAEVIHGLPVRLPLLATRSRLLGPLEALGRAVEARAAGAGAGGPVAGLRDGSWTLTLQPGGIQGFTGLNTLELRVGKGDETGLTCLLNVPIPPEPLPAAGSTPLPRSGGKRDRKETPPGFSLPVTPGGWEAMLTRLSETTGRPVVSDAFTVSRTVEFLYSEDQPPGPLAEFLDHAAGRWKKRWGSVGPVLTLRSAAWPVLRAKQIPPSQVRRWRQDMIATGSLALIDLLEMTRLRPCRQAELGAAVCREAADAVAQHRRFLVLWDGFPGAARRKAEGEGLSLRDLPVKLQPGALRFYQDHLGATDRTRLARCRLQVRVREAAVTYTFEEKGRFPVRQEIPLKLEAATVQRIRRETAALEL